jgi:hypothetical protein
MLRNVGRRLREGVSYANVVATLALFVALGGVSYAALTLPAGSVGRVQLRDAAVTLPKLAFPLGIATASETGPIAAGEYHECKPPPGGSCMPEHFTVLTSVSLNLAAPTEVLLFGSAAFYATNFPARGIVSVHLGSTIDGSGYYRETTNLTEVIANRVLSFHQLVALGAGHHTIALTGNSSAPQREHAEQAQLEAIVMPKIG